MVENVIGFPLCAYQYITGGHNFTSFSDQGSAFWSSGELLRICLADPEQLCTDMKET